MDKKRVISLLAGLAVMVAGLGVRMGFLGRGKLSMAAEQQSTYTLTVARSRGTVYDTHLTPLVNTGSRYCISAVPTPEVMTSLAGQLDTDTYAAVEKRMAGGTPVTLSMDRPPDTVTGIMAFQVPVRLTDELASSHIVGYLDSEGAHGLTGAEYVFDNLLNEYAGEVAVTYTMDGTGQWMQGVPVEVENTLSRTRGGVALTLDNRVQKIAKRAALRYLPRGAAVVCDSATGRVLASVSTPDYQPDEVAELLNDAASPLLNRTFCNYNCGSVFKMVTAVAALEQGISPTTSYTCTGRIGVEGVTFRCHRQLGHSRVGMVSGFAGSCNPYFIQLATRMGRDPLYRMAAALGFDRALTLADGWRTDNAVLPGTGTLSPSALANLSIGQGDLLATPLHIAALVGSVVNEGQWRSPTLFKGEVNQEGVLTEAPLAPQKQVFSPSTAALLRQMMEETVLTGTGRAAAPARGTAGGKTGTAETGWTPGENAAVVQSWFAGYYPADNPRYVIVTLAEDADNTGGDSSAAFRQICEQLASL